MKFINIFLAILLTACVSEIPQTIESDTPSKAGFEEQLLNNIDSAMQGYIDRREIAGISTMLVKDDSIVQQGFYGYADISESRLLDEESIFRIYSMTKPIVSVAIMILYEEGKFELDDEVSKYIPEFRDLKVFGGIENGEARLVDQETPMTIRHLFTHTAGFGYGYNRGFYVDSLYEVAGIWSRGNLQEMVNMLKDIPIKNQPGSKWEYSLSIDILGYLAEVLSGKPLDEFLESRFFTPLKMDDTGFFVREADKDRFTTVYTPDPENGIRPLDIASESSFLLPPGRFSGGGGLVSTLDDYARFCQMILNGGELEGVRVLKESTIKMIIQNQMPGGRESHPGKGWGLGFQISLNDPDPGESGAKGILSWGGAADTHFWIDPVNKITLLAFAQQQPQNKIPFYTDFFQIVYDSMIRDTE